MIRAPRLLPDAGAPAEVARRRRGWVDRRCVLSVFGMDVLCVLSVLGMDVC